MIYIFIYLQDNIVDFFYIVVAAAIFSVILTDIIIIIIVSLKYVSVFCKLIQLVNWEWFTSEEK